MKGYRFYLDYDNPKNKRKGIDNGNCLAVVTEGYIMNGGLMFEGFSPVFFQRNSPVNWSSVSWDYLRTCCKRIPERKAREIHPALFERLDEK
jgi:hypothetical protein